MKDIFKKLEGRKWDMFGGKKAVVTVRMAIGKGWMIKIYWNDGSNEYYSLADLLANKSWCIVIWGEEDKVWELCFGCGIASAPCSCVKEIAWDYLSSQAFIVLRDEGEKSVIEFIKQTMI